MQTNKSNILNFFGDKKLFSILKENYLNNALPNSIIIYGNEGIGKSSFVYFFVKNLFYDFPNSLNNTKNAMHNNLINNLSHPNFMVIELEYDEKNKKLKSQINVEQIRKIKNFINKSSIYDLPKIVLIDSGDLLNKHASNSLLKVLEEPKKNSYFFIISHQTSLLLPTIRSRCIKFKLDNLNYSNFEKIILTNSDIQDNDNIKFLFDLTNGSPGLSLKYNLTLLNIFNEMINLLYLHKYMNQKYISFINEILAQKEDGFLAFLTIIKFILLNIIKINLGFQNNQVLISSVNNEIKKLNSLYSSNKCLSVLNYINSNEKDILSLNIDRKTFILNIFSEIFK